MTLSHSTLISGVFVKNGDSDNITFTIEDPDGTNLGDIGNDNHEISVNVSGLKMIKDKTSINQTYGIYDNDGVDMLAVVKQLVL